MKVLRDSWLVFGRYVGMSVRNPVWMVLGTLQPLIYLFLFGPLLKSIASVRGFPPGGALNVFVPGLVIQLGLFGATFVGFSLVAELQNGLVERLRVTPVSRVALLLGRAGRDVVTLMAASLILLLLSVPLGLTLHPVGLLVILALQALLGLFMASLSYALALRLRNEDTFAAVLTTITPPLLLLSGFLLPLTLAPAWLQDLALANPLSYAVTAARAAFNDHLSDPSVVKGVVIIGVLAIVTVYAAAREFGSAIA